MWRRKLEVGIRAVTIAFGFIIGLYKLQEYLQIL